MKILYVCCNFTWGGVEQFVLNTVDHIDREKYEIEVLLPDRDTPYDREPDLQSRGVRVIKYRYRGSKEKCEAFRRVLTETHYDAVHFHTGRESAMLAKEAKACGIEKIIIHSHTTQSGDTNTKLVHRIKKAAIVCASKWIYRRYICVACSADAAAFMFGKNNHAVLLQNGIDCSRFYRDPDAKPFGICINARFNRQKNPLFVVDVMDALVKKDDRITLDWIGTGELREQVGEKIKACSLSGHIRLLGSRKDVETVLAENRWFLLPSLYEGMGIVLVEAQAAGMTCFVSDVIPQAADCGGMIPISLEKSAQEWADIIYPVMCDGQAAPIDRDKLAQFDIRNTVLKLQEIYDS